MRLVKDEVREGSYDQIRNRGWYTHTSLVGARGWMRIPHPTIKDLYYEVDLIILEKVEDNVVKPLKNMLQ